MNSSAAASRSSVVMPGRRISRMSARGPPTMRPARAMISSSRGDFSVIMLVAKGLPDTVGNLLDRTFGGNPTDGTPLLVPGEHRRRLLPIGAQPGGDGGRVVIGALLQLSAPGQPG